MAAKKKTKKGKPSGQKRSNVTKQNTVTPEVVKQEKNEVTADKKAKDGNSKANKAPKKTAKNKKPNIIVRAIDFIKSVFAELKKVSWLTGDELMKSTSVVAGIVAIMTLMTWVVDSGLGALAALLIGSK
ncbi:preprotein translocase subunit SecE [Eubacterium barkeri]|uniref:Protein translocase subunit SecE n=1 Tax=Eubacterium barkeri TaxID=1528 RepID=A0A1H3DB95_EUBBA|nr:preprotein translocase subunit SecE [Eubacterium barkeri]SDX63580.1 preprotein translocase subunit SecE [Eubacterium barkeri]